MWVRELRQSRLMDNEAGWIFQAAAFQKALDVLTSTTGITGDPRTVEAVNLILDETSRERQIYAVGVNSGITATLLVLKEYGLLKSTT